MDPIARLTFPFTVRDMLAFQHGAAFGLRIVSQSSSTAPVIIRGMTSEGLFAFTHIPTDNSIIATENFRISDIPIWVSVTDKAGSLVQGDTYITLSVTINSDILYELCSGLVYRQKSISWPQISSLDMRPGGGKIVDKTGNDAAAGAETGITVPAGQIWRFIGAELNVVMSVQAAARRVGLLFNLVSGTDILCAASADQIASETWKFSCAAYGSNVTPPSELTAQINTPRDLLLLPGDNVQSSTVNIQTDDNYAPIILRVEQFFNPA